MNRTLHAPTPLLIAALAVLLAAGPVHARSPERSAATDMSKTDSLSTGSINTARDRKKRFDDCMAIWEPATHMSKKEWRRTCNRQLDEASEF
jgi:hypothetical protein